MYSLGRSHFTTGIETQIVIFTVTMGIRPTSSGADTVCRALADLIWGLTEECWQINWTQRPRLPSILECLEQASLCYKLPAESCLTLKEDRRHDTHMQEGVDHSDSESYSDNEDIRRGEFSHTLFLG